MSAIARMETSGAVVLLSGGMDSSTLLHHVARAGRAPLHALSFDYGQRHARELECACRQAAAAGVAEHQIIDARFLGDLLKQGSALLEGGAAVPDLDDLDPSQRDQPPTYVPNRNMMLLAMAAAYAEARGVADVFYGAQAQDEYGYWDCTQVFLERINALLALNRAQPVQVHAPFVAMTKAAIVKLGIKLGVDYAQTWTCYRGGAVPCGTCPTCVERRNAFGEAGVPDPLWAQTSGIEPQGGNIMLVVHVHVHVLPGCVEAFHEATVENARQSVLEPGIARFDVIQQQDDPTRFVLVEAYRTAADPARHKETAHYQTWRETVADMMAEPRQSVKYRNCFPDDAGW